MRFLFVNPLPFPTTRAYGIQLAKTADALIEAGHSAELWIPSYEAPYPGARDTESIKKAYGVKHLPVIRTIDMRITPHRSFGVAFLNVLWFRLVVRQFAKRARRLLEKESADSVVITRDPLVVNALRGVPQKVFWEIEKLGSMRSVKRALVSVDGILPLDHVMEKACVDLGFPKNASSLEGIIGSLPFIEQRVRNNKTVIVPIFDGVISKNIVDSGALQPLIEHGYRVLLWVYEAKADYYRGRYGPKGFEVIEYGEPRIPLWATGLYNFALDTIPTRMVFLKHTRRMLEKKKYFLGSLRILLWGLGHVPPIRFVFQRLALIWPVPLKIKALVRIESPVMVFCPTMIWLAEIQLIRHAKKMNIPSIGMDKSWDNITSKLILPVKPDLLIVPNERCQKEAEHYLNFPLGKTIPVGLPQFDRYVEPGLLEQRDVFFTRTGLDPAKPMMLYCAAGLWMAKDEPDVLLWLDKEIEKGRFGPLQVLVRLHPKYDCGADKLIGTKHLIIERPGTYITKDLWQWEYEDADLRHLLSSIRFASVTVNTSSTMSIEAAYFDKPVINIAIDPKPVPYHLSIARYYEREHYKPIIDAGGATLARTFEDFGSQIERYLADPSLDHEGRERVIREQCIDRQPIAAKRLADVLLTHLGYSS